MLPSLCPLEPDETVPDLQKFRANFQRGPFQAMWMGKQPFWNVESDDFGHVIETIPLVGELLLEEFQRGQPDQQLHRNVFWTFCQMSCLWLCLVQWLDTQQANSPAKQAMARAMCDFEAEWLKQQSERDHSNERLGYSMLLARRLLRQMAEARVKKEHPYTWLIAFAQRPLPALPMGRKMSLLRADRDDIKEENQRLKEVFLCANQQGWATPDAIAHINRCNESCRMDIWLQCWMRQMMNQQRVVTVDEGELAAELCLAATITYPVPCLCEMVKQLVECVLFERPTTLSNIAAQQLKAPQQLVANILHQPQQQSFSSSSSTSAATVGAGQDGQQQQQQQHSVAAAIVASAGAPPTEHQQPNQQQHSHLPQQPRPHPQLPHLLVTRHPVVGQLSTKVTVLAKMLVRAMQLLLWAGDRRAVEKRERERRIQQFGLGECQMDISAGSKKRKLQQQQPQQGAAESPQQQQQLKPPARPCGLEPTSSEGSGGEEMMAATSSKEASTSTPLPAAKMARRPSAPGPEQPIPMEEDESADAVSQIAALKVAGSPSGKTSTATTTTDPPTAQKQQRQSGTPATTSTTATIPTIRHPKDAFKAQQTVRNVFERFERIVRDCTLRPPVTFIIFFVHELAQAPRTEYWHRLVELMPVQLIFALARLDAPAFPLELFMRIYDPAEERNRKHCLQFACMMRKLDRL